MYNKRVIFILLTILIFSFLFAQEKARSRYPVYIEVDRSIQQKLDIGLSKEQTKIGKDAWEFYQKFWNSTQAVTQTPIATFTIPQLQDLLSATSNLKEVSLGQYTGVGEYIRKRVSNLATTGIDFPTLHKQAIDDYQDAVSKKDWEKLYLLIHQYPTWVFDGNILLELSDYFLNQGMVHKALGILYRLKFWNFPFTKEQSFYLDMRLALASALIGDWLVVDNLAKDYDANNKNTSKNNKRLVSWKGELVKISKFFESLRKERLQIKITDWPDLGGNISHSYLPEGYNLQNKTMNLDWEIQENSIFSSPLIIGQYAYCYMRYAQKSNVIAIHLPSKKIVWKTSIFDYPVSNSYANIAMNPENFQTLAFSQNRIYACFRSVSPLKEYVNNSLYCLDASNGSLLWHWPEYKNSPLEKEDFSNVFKDEREFEEEIILNKMISSKNFSSKIISTVIPKRICYPKQRPKDFNGDVILDSNPIVYDGKVFISLVVIGGQISQELVCLDAISGQIKWKTFIASVSPINYTKISKSEYTPYPTYLAAGYGLIYTCFNYGVVAAIDIYTGEIRWLSKYHDLLPQKYRLYSKNQDVIKTSLLVKHGKLYVIPSDVSIIFVYNAITGEFERCYPDGEYSGNFSHFFGVDNSGQIWLGTQDSIFMLNENGNQEIGKIIKLQNGVIIFNSCLTQDWLYVDTNLSLEQIHTSTGTTISLPALNPKLENSRTTSLIFLERKNCFIQTGKAFSLINIIKN